MSNIETAMTAAGGVAAVRAAELCGDQPIPWRTLATGLDQDWCEFLLGYRTDLAGARLGPGDTRRLALASRIEPASVRRFKTVWLGDTHAG